MNDSSIDPDRAILEAKKAFRLGDPERTLTDSEFDCLLSHLCEFGNLTKSEMRPFFDRHFQIFIDMATEERFRERDGHLEKVPKPTTIVAREMKQLLKACENLDGQLARLKPVTRTWIDQHLKEIGAEDENGGRVRLRDLEKHLNRPIDLLVFSARKAEDIASRGPNNAALKAMIEGLAYCWERYHGGPPTTDKGRGLKDDPFLELCKEMARIGDTRLKVKGGRLGSLQLSGLVAEVVKNLSSKATKTPKEK